MTHELDADRISAHPDREITDAPAPPWYTDRLCSAEETLDRVSPCLPEYGITRLARLTGLDRIGIPVWAAVRPNSRSLSVYQGKGITDADAKVSATMEALERAVAECPPLARKTATPAQLETEQVAFDILSDLTAAGASPPDRETTLCWVEATELALNSHHLVPLEAICLDRTRAWRYWQSSDGLASGNTQDEAVFHGLLERIERDADILWRLNSPARRRQTCFDPAALHDCVVHGLIDRIHDAGLQLKLFDMSSDIGVPVVSALLGPQPSAANKRPRCSEYTTGSGAHPCAVRASIRAITEAVQSRLTLISGARDDLSSADYDGEPSPTIVEDLASAPRCSPPGDAYPAQANHQDQTSRLVGVLRGAGISRVYAVNLNPREDRFSVAKVLVPDLENPVGKRRHRFGRRALSRLMRFR